MEKTKKIVLIIFIIGGALLLALAILLNYNASPSTLVGWTVGLGLCLLLIGTGNMIAAKLEARINTASFTTPEKESVSRSDFPCQFNIPIKEKAGYMACKITYLILGIYVLILSWMHVPIKLLIMAISLLVIKFILDLTFQIHYSKK